MQKKCLCSRYAIFLHRKKNKVDQLESKILSKLFRFILSVFNYFLIVFCKIKIDERSKIGHDLWLSPKGRIIVGADMLGDRCVIHHNVTIGMGLGDINKNISPRIKNNVWIGPDTILHGDIEIGEGATILARTVVSRTIPGGVVVQGNPMRVILKKFNNEKLRSSTRYDVSRDTLSVWDEEES